MRFLLLALLFSGTAFAMDATVEGNVEAQGRHSWNNPEAQDLSFPLTQDWNESDSHLIFGNVNPKVEFENSRVEVNWFLRHSVSELYEDSYLAPRIFTFPNRLVARDIFKLQHRDDGPDSQTDSVLNKFYYERNIGDHRVAVGRMFINYGTGEIFNPINPFNQPTGLTSINNVAQGNDGGQFKFFLSDKHTIDFLLLGDKAIEGYEGKIDTTAWIHGEYLFSDEFTLDYVGGRDQKRNKLGSQLAYKFSEAMVFFQALYQSNYVDVEFGDSHPLWDLLLGYDEQLSAKWHLRFEGGYQKANRVFVFNANSIGDRFLPVEYFAALANTYEFHPLLKGGLTIINDPTTGFTYGVTRLTASLGSSIEGEIFGFSPLAKGSDDGDVDEANELAQKFVTQDLGLALRAFF